MISSSEKRSDLLAILALMTGLLVFKAWVVGINNVFVMDDFSNVLQDNHDRLLESLKLLPRQLYNDRPLGFTFYYLTATRFNLNYMVEHALHLLFHAFNTLTIYYIFRKLLIAPLPAFFGALVFAVNPMSTLCVHWTSGTFDLFALMFAVSSYALLLYHLEDRRQMPYFTPVMLLACYVLSVRSKEASIFLPFTWLALMAIYHVRHKRTLKDYLGELRVLIPGFVFFCALFCTYVMLKANAIATGSMTTDPQSPYYQSFFPPAMAVKLVHYLHLYFGKSSLILIVVLLSCAIFCRKVQLLILACFVGFAFLIILPMVNSTHQLYLYGPSFSVALLLAVSLDAAIQKLSLGKAQFVAVALLTALACFHFHGLENQYFNHYPWLQLAKANRDQMIQLKTNLTRLAGSEKFLVYNLPPHAGPQIFTVYGPGNSIRLYTGLKNIQCDIDPNPTVSPEVKARYDVLINFNQGKMIFEKTPKNAPPVRYRGIY